MAHAKENYKLEEPEEVLISKIFHIVPVQQNIYINKGAFFMSILRLKEKLRWDDGIL